MMIRNNSIFLGGNGESPEEAIKINIENSGEGVAAEYLYLEQKFGKKGVDWNLKEQKLIMHNGNMFDLLIINLTNGEEKEIYFDIKEFY